MNRMLSERRAAPSPLVGEGGEGGREEGLLRRRTRGRMSSPKQSLSIPTPNPSPQGGASVFGVKHVVAGEAPRFGFHE